MAPLTRVAALSGSGRKKTHRFDASASWQGNRWVVCFEPFCRRERSVSWAGACRRNPERSEGSDNFRSTPLHSVLTSKTLLLLLRRARRVPGLALNPSSLTNRGGCCLLCVPSCPLWLMVLLFRFPAIIRLTSWHGCTRQSPSPAYLALPGCIPRRRALRRDRRAKLFHDAQSPLPAAERWPRR